jgi:GT2 family glycosyltransferase
MKLSIVIVSWNVKNYLKKCLSSINRHAINIEKEIFVVDNASTDGTVEMVQTEFPEVKLIANDKNTGFAFANNQAIKESSGEYILLLNPDTELTDDSLQQAINLAESNPQIGIIGCKHLNTDGSLQASVRRFPTLAGMFLILTKLAKIFPRTSAIQRYYATDMNYSQAQKVQQVAGSFMLLKKSMLEKVDLLDEGFFIWFEEVDLCKRAKDEGWEVWYTPNTNIIHHGGQSFSQRLTVKKQYLFFKSAFRYFKKHGFR